MIGNWQDCKAVIRDIEVSTSGVIWITLQACGDCTECIEYVANFRSRRLVRVLEVQKMTTKQLDLEYSLQSKTKAIVLYDLNNSEEQCVIEVEHRLNTTRFHTLMCCSRPHRSVRIEENSVIILSFKACNSCIRCVGNVSNC